MTTLDPPLDPPAPPAAVAPKHPPRRPVLVIRARSGWAAVNLRELWRFRELLLSFTARDIKLRYKQTALGVIWVLLQPLITAAILTYVFSRLAGMTPPNTAAGKPVPYFLFAFSGMVAWGLFFSALSKISNILVGNSSLISKVYFPRLLLPLSGATGVLVDLGVSMGLLLILQIATGVGLTPQWLLSPIFLALILALALGIGTWASALSVEYRDVAYILPVFLQFLLFASPIGYVIHADSIFYFNPLAGLMDAWRWSVLSTPFPPMWAFVYAATVAIACLVIGAFVFRRMERNFADVI